MSIPTVSMSDQPTKSPPPTIDAVKMTELLHSRVAAGKPNSDGFVREVNAYAAAPDEVVRGLRHALQPKGRGPAWAVFSAATYSKRGVRSRQIGGAGDTVWHGEKGKKPVLGPKKEFLGANKRKFSYCQKIPSGKTGEFKFIRLGWTMIEVELEQPHGADQELVICLLYRSNGKDLGTSMKAGTEAFVGQAAGISISGDELGQYAKGKGKAIVEELTPTPATADIHSSGQISIFIAKKTDAQMPVRHRGVVMKFGRTSIASSERMKAMAELVLSSPVGPGEQLALILSAMGDTNDNIIKATAKALKGNVLTASDIPEVKAIRELYTSTAVELGLDTKIVSGLLDELEHHLKYVGMIKDLTTASRDFLVSFGERTSTQVFYEYLNELGTETLQEFELLPITTVGRGSSDLTAVTICRTLRSRELQIWTDSDGLLTCDPKVCGRAVSVPHLTFNEAAELRLFGEQSMQLAREGEIMSVVVKNCYNLQALGTLITKTRIMSKMSLTNIVLTSNVTVLDIESTSILTPNEFEMKAFSVFKRLGISVDYLYISDEKMSIALFPSNQLSGELVPMLYKVVEELEKISAVRIQPHRAVISLIGNPLTSRNIVEEARDVLRTINVEIQRSYGCSFKVLKVSLVVNDREAHDCVRALHVKFFEKDVMPEVEGAGNESLIPEKSLAAASSSGMKRKADETGSIDEELFEGDNDVIPGGGQDRSGTGPTSDELLEVNNDLIPGGGDNAWEKEIATDIIPGDVLMPLIPGDVLMPLIPGDVLMPLIPDDIMMPIIPDDVPMFFDFTFGQKQEFTGMEDWFSGHSMDSGAYNSFGMTCSSMSADIAYGDRFLAQEEVCL